MLPVEDAVARVLSTVVAMPAEMVGIEEAGGRVLAADLESPVDVPPWNCSAMDGYAVRSEDVAQLGARLRVQETITAGAVPTVDLASGTTSAVMTGAPLPEGADAVIMIEDSDGAREGVVTLSEVAYPGKYVRRAGCDIARGATVLTAGTTLGAGALGLAASIGLDRVSVARRPRVAILTTGDELVRPGQPRGPGQIWSTNHLTLAALTRQAGAVPVDHGVGRDDPDALREALLGCLAEADVALTTGGVSVGDHDHMKPVMASLGIEMDFWKVRMKPGKPLAFGVYRRDGHPVPVFGLPGNPVSCMVNFLQVVRPWVRRSMGDPTPFLPVLDAVAAEDFRSRAGRARFERVCLAWEGGQLVARSTGDQSSGILTSMARAHALLLIAPDDQGPQAGDAVRVQLLDARFAARADAGLGW